MSRIKFKKGDQTKFLRNVLHDSGKRLFQLAKELSVHPRTLRDWLKEKYTLPEKAFKKLTILNKRGNIPHHLVLIDRWHLPDAARKGGLALAKKYGGPGTPEGRRKGGIRSQLQRRTSPSLYSHCNIRKKIRRPLVSADLAEFIGMVLGDGGINTNYQVVITLHRKNDAQYSLYVKNLIENLFSLTPSLYYYRGLQRRNVVGVTISSANVVDFLIKKGLCKGNKVKNQVDVPAWIKRRTIFSIACLRGLMDTDGGIYIHRHKHQKGIYLGLVFSNSSIPLLHFVKSLFTRLGFHPKLNWRGKNVRLYREEEILRFEKEIRFHNNHHSRRIKTYLEEKYLERCVSG